LENGFIFTVLAMAVARNIVDKSGFILVYEAGHALLLSDDDLIALEHVLVACGRDGQSPVAPIDTSKVMDSMEEYANNDMPRMMVQLWNADDDELRRIIARYPDMEALENGFDDGMRELSDLLQCVDWPFIRIADGVTVRGVICFND
jgi:hypothetical protein